MLLGHIGLDCGVNLYTTTNDLKTPIVTKSTFTIQHSLISLVICILVLVSLDYTMNYSTLLNNSLDVAEYFFGDFFLIWITQKKWPK